MMMFVVAAAAIGEIPYFRYLLAGETVSFDKVLAQAAVDIPTPALAAARTFLARVDHGVVIRFLLLRRKLQAVVRDESCCEARGNVIWIVGNLQDGLTGDWFEVLQTLP